MGIRSGFILFTSVVLLFQVTVGDEIAGTITERNSTGLLTLRAKRTKAHFPPPAGNAPGSRFSTTELLHGKRKALVIVYLTLFYMDVYGVAAS